MNMHPMIDLQPSAYSAPSAATVVERRAGARLRTVYRVAHVQTGDDSGLARIYNISDEGLGLHLHMPVMLGDKITVHLSENHTIEGHVVWTCDGDCGLQLNAPIDSGVLLKEMAVKARLHESRPLRIPVEKPAVARSEIGLRKITIQDVSQQGMKVRHDGSFSEGLHVKVSLASGMDRRGVVRWSREGVAGIILLQPFSTSELGSTKNL